MNTPHNHYINYNGKNIAFLHNQDQTMKQFWGYVKTLSANKNIVTTLKSTNDGMVAIFTNTNGKKIVIKVIQTNDKVAHL